MCRDFHHNVNFAVRPQSPLMPKDTEEVPVEDIAVEDPKEREAEDPEPRGGGEKSGEDPPKESGDDCPEESEEDRSREEEGSGLSGNDFLFLIGLGLLIFYLVLNLPYTPSVAHIGLLFWMSVSMLFLSMAPDYLNEERAREWSEHYEGTKLEGLYGRIHSVASNGDRYFSSGKFFAAGVVLTLLAVAVLFWRGEIPEYLFGISYGVLMRAILV